jgi:hypothetical protein
MNFNYWTGGIQKSCKSQWAWCSGTRPYPLPENLKWVFNQPDNKNGSEDCLHMRFFQNNTGIALSDRDCGDKFVIACEVRIIMPFILQYTVKVLFHRVNQNCRLATSHRALLMVVARKM